MVSTAPDPPPVSAEKRPLLEPFNSSSQPLIACQRCRAKKIKCDDHSPRCRACDKADVDCLILDLQTQLTYTRRQIHELQEEIQQLVERLAVDGHHEANDTRIQQAVTSDPETQPSSMSQAGPSIPRFVGEESGIEYSRGPCLDVLNWLTTSSSFMNYVLNSIDTSSANTGSQNLLASNSTEPRIVYVPPYPFPSRLEARSLCDEYFDGFHLQHPIISRPHLWDLFNRIFDLFEVEPVDVASISKKYRQELFTLNMCFALACVTLHPKDQHNKHPFGYFMAALQALSPAGFGFDTIQDIQNFLLIARFGTFQFIGCSVWELSQICLKICLELKMQKKSLTTSSHVSIDEQMRRRVFWECYVLDRNSSSTLGRPFGLSDSDISIELPLDVSDEELTVASHASATNPSPASVRLGINTEMTLAIQNIKLAQLTSSIHVAMHANPHERGEKPRSRKAYTYGGSSSDTSSRPGETYVAVQTFTQKLQQWWNSRPSYQHVQSVYQTEEYFELQFQKEKLGLIRMAIDRVPSKNTFPPKELLVPCLKSALRVISLINDLCRKGLATLTRASMQLIFSAGLSIIFSIFGQAHRTKAALSSTWGVGVEDWWADLEDGNVNAPEISKSYILTTLDDASKIMALIASEMGDLQKYARFFESLRREVDRFLERDSSRNSPKPSRGNAATAVSGPGQHVVSSRMVSNPTDQPLPSRAATIVDSTQQPGPPAHELTPAEGQPNWLDDPLSYNEYDPNAQLDPFDHWNTGGRLASNPLDLDMIFQDFQGYDSMSMPNPGGQTAPFESWPFSQVFMMGQIASGLGDYTWEGELR